MDKITTLGKSTGNNNITITVLKHLQQQWPNHRGNQLVTSCLLISRKSSIQVTRNQLQITKLRDVTVTDIETNSLN